MPHDSYDTHCISLEGSQHGRLIQFRLTEGAETRSGPTRTARTHGRRSARAFTSMTNVLCVPSLFRLLCPKSVTVEIHGHRVMVPLQAPLFGMARPTFSNSRVMVGLASVSKGSSICEIGTSPQRWVGHRDFPVTDCGCQGETSPLESAK